MEAMFDSESSHICFFTTFFPATTLCSSLYNKVGRTYLFDVDFWHLNYKSESGAGNKYTVDAFHAGNVSVFFLSPLHPGLVADVNVQLFI